MGYYGCNRGTVVRAEEKGKRVIIATVEHDDIVTPEFKTQRHVVEGWDANALELATQWLIRQMMQLSM